MARAYDVRSYQGVIELAVGCYLLHALDAHGGDYDVYVDSRYVGSRATEAEATAHAQAEGQRLRRLYQLEQRFPTDELSNIEQTILALCDSIDSATSLEPAQVLTHIRLREALHAIRDAQRSWNCTAHSL